MRKKVVKALVGTLGLSKISITKPKEVNWFKGKLHLSEIYQEVGMVFAFCSNSDDPLKSCHPWVKCRDYLHDAVRTQLTGEISRIYGFEFDKESNPPVDLNNMRMFVSMSDYSKERHEEYEAVIKDGLKLVNYFEELAGETLSYVEEVDPKGSNKPIAFLFTSPKMWLSSPFLISMYTLLLRSGYKHITQFSNEEQFLSLINNSDKKDNDHKYLSCCGNILHSIIKNRSKLFEVNEDGWHKLFFAANTINTFHNNCGIVSLAQGISPDKEVNNKVMALKTAFKS